MKCTVYISLIELLETKLVDMLTNETSQEKKSFFL